MIGLLLNLKTSMTKLLELIEKNLTADNSGSEDNLCSTTDGGTTIEYTLTADEEV